MIWLAGFCLWMIHAILAGGMRSPCGERAGGRDPQPPTFIQPPPVQTQPSPVPPPDAGETAADIARARLQFDPQLAAQQFQLFQQFAPQTAAIQAGIQQDLAPGLARSQFGIQQELTPLARALFEQVFPTQTGTQELLAQQAQQRLLSPTSLTPEQQAAQEAIRGRAREQVARNIRESANVGGTLFGGRREQREDRALTELEQQFAAEDIQRQQTQRDQLLRELIAANQVVFPQIQQPGIPQGFSPAFQTAAPSPDALLQAILGAQSQFIVNPAQGVSGVPGQPGFFGQLAQGFAGR